MNGERIREMPKDTDALQHAKGVRAAADLASVQLVGAKNLQEADKTLQQAGLQPVNRKLKKITKEDLKDIFENKKPPVVGDTFTNAKGSRVEVTKISPRTIFDKAGNKVQLEGGAIVDIMTFPTKGVGRGFELRIDTIAGEGGSLPSKADFQKRSKMGK